MSTKTFKRAKHMSGFQQDSSLMASSGRQDRVGLPEDGDDARKAARRVMGSKEWAEFGPTNHAKCIIDLVDRMERHM
ncbi:hypothetical protein FKW77_003677 [Venturia effusa]|uniref:Uncharacterized protein n=1 Tax=Venturia effusa TaxID=50376 RepID=A0A517LDL8_9PEZI|nr:hypothetical protein FKW77_003677 [Venturia effusa]